MHVCGAVVEGGNASLLTELRELRILYLALAVGIIQEEHHGGFFADGVLEFGAGSDLDHLDTRIADAVVVIPAMGFLDDDLTLQPGQIGDLIYLSAVNT